MKKLREIINSSTTRKDLDSLIAGEYEIDDNDLPVILETGNKFREQYGKSYRALEAVLVFGGLILELKKERCEEATKFFQELTKLYLEYYDSFETLTPEEKYYISPPDEKIKELFAKFPFKCDEQFGRTYTEFRLFFKNLIVPSDEKRAEAGWDPVLFDAQHYFGGMLSNLDARLVRIFDSQPPAP